MAPMVLAAGELTGIGLAYKTLAPGMLEPVVIRDKSFHSKGLQGGSHFIELHFIPQFISEWRQQCHFDPPETFSVAGPSGGQ
jgi:hypothetical protein